VDALWNAPNRARAYLESRGVPEETARELGLGFAPEGWDFLARRLSASFTPDILIEAGILQPGTEGKRPYDRQRDRLVFPIRDERGFGGRSLGRSRST
jgi:DNA primase